MIPRIIHQTSRTAQVSPQWGRYQAQARKLHPDWEYRHWTDADNAELVRQSAPHLLPLYNSLKGIMKVDMIRYVYMQVFGGVYMDFDYEPVRPFDMGDRTLVVPRENDDDKPVYLGNSFLASEAGHRFWDDALAELARSMTALGRDPIEEEVAGTSGPGLLTRIYVQNRALYPDLYFGRREEFNPSMPADATEYAEIVRSGRIYGIHHCDGTWRAKTLPHRAVRKLASLWRRAGR